MATKAEILQNVGEDLGLVPIGQALESQDQNRISTTFDQVYKRLEEKELATWAFSGEVPDKVVPYFVLMMLEKLLVSYSVPDSRFIRIKNDAGENGKTALLNIAELVVPVYVSTDEPTDF